MWRVFKGLAQEKENQSIIAKEDFAKGLRQLEAHGLKSLSASYITDLYDRLDTSRDGTVELFELVSGLSLMCGGSDDEKLGVFFDLYDATHTFSSFFHFLIPWVCSYDRNGDGSLTREEIELLINTAVKNGFRATLHRNDKLGGSSSGNQNLQEQLTEQLADELAQNLATQLAAPFLEMLDKDGNGAITLDEFKAAKGMRPLGFNLTLKSSFTCAHLASHASSIQAAHCPFSFWRQIKCKCRQN
jgi:Ca2+-binding EF-hand superfamily protein